MISMKRAVRPILILLASLLILASCSRKSGGKTHCGGDVCPVGTALVTR